MGRAPLATGQAVTRRKVGTGQAVTRRAATGSGGYAADGGYGPGGYAAGRYGQDGRGTAAPERAGPDEADKAAKPGTALALRNEPPAKRPVTDAETELAEFAKDLRELRIKAGLGYPDMAELSHYTMKTLAAAAGGLNLPTLPVTAAYVRACDGNVAEWEDRWHRAADVTEARDGGTPEPGRAADGAAGRSAPAGTGAGPAGNGPAGNGPAGNGPAGNGPDNGAPRGTASGEPAGQRAPRPSQVASPRPAREGPSAPDPAPPRPPDPGPEQVYVITSAAPRRPFR